MSTRNRVPPAIAPYLELPPEASSIVLTGTLGYTPNWLIALFVGSILGRNPVVDTNPSKSARYAVILISWMRDADFWRDEIRRTTSLDISKLSQQGSFVFLDCLTTNTLGSLDTSDALVHPRQSIEEAILKLSVVGECQVLLILDNPDVLLATQSSTAQNLNHFIMKLRTLVHATVVCCSADSSLLSASLQPLSAYPSPMEVEAAAFLMQQSHNACYVMSLRGIPSGAAVDVSGELRITIGAGYDLYDPTQQEAQEAELLYLVQRDGSIKVFRRGEENA